MNTAAGARADVIVVGAGSSGAAVSAFLAERGLRVMCVERRPLDEAGARWVNGVPRAAFADAGVALPEHGESYGLPAPFHLVADGGRALVSGLAGARLLGQPAVARNHLCAAAQEVRAVRDVAAARAFFASHGVVEGEVLGLVGVAGGYSVLNVRLHHGGTTMGILTGTIPSQGFPSGKSVLDTFVREQSWVGERIFGGSGAIPLSRAHARLADDRIAVLGDAGCQVFPAHGSGVGSGLLAARLLADTLARRGSLRDYEVAWHRRYGAMFAFFDVFRRWNQTVDAKTLGRALALGLVDGEALRAGLDQVFPRPSFRLVAHKLRALAGEPALAAALAGTVLRSAAVRVAYARYPHHPSRVTQWARRVDRLLGDH